MTNSYWLNHTSHLAVSVFHHAYIYLANGLLFIGFISVNMLSGISLVATLLLYHQGLTGNIYTCDLFQCHCTCVHARPQIYPYIYLATCT